MVGSPTSLTSSLSELKKGIACSLQVGRYTYEGNETAERDPIISRCCGNGKRRHAGLYQEETTSRCSGISQKGGPGVACVEYQSAVFENYRKREKRSSGGQNDFNRGITEKVWCKGAGFEKSAPRRGPTLAELSDSSEMPSSASPSAKRCSSVSPSQ